MRESVRASAACHFVTGDFPASDPYIVEQFNSRGLLRNRRSSAFYPEIMEVSEYARILNEYLCAWALQLARIIRYDGQSPIDHVGIGYIPLKVLINRKAA